MATQTSLGANRRLNGKGSRDEKLESLTVFLCRADTETECIDADQGSIGYEMKLGDTKLGTLLS
jgi:hypothetical protein